MKYNKNIIPLGLILLSSYSAAVYAEDNVRRERSSVLEEVIVTAQKKEEAMSDVPLAISAFTGETLKNLGADDIQDFSRLVPGLNANENGGITIFTLRGVGFNDPTYTATGTVGLYIDEINIPYSPMAAGPSFDLNRIEVLKGPQGTLYGRNTTGGIINYIPNSPSQEAEGGIEIGYGNYKTATLEGFYSTPLGEKFAIRVSGKLVNSGEGWQKSITRPGDRLGEKDEKAYRVIADWLLSENSDLRFIYSGWQNNSDSQAAQPVGIQSQNPFFGEAAVHPRIRNFPFVANTDDPALAEWVPRTEENQDDYLVPERNDTFNLFSLKYSTLMGESMELIASISHLVVEADGSAKTTTGIDVYNVDADLFGKIETNAFEIRISDSAFDGKFNWMAGINYSQDDGEETNRLFFHTVSLFAAPAPVPWVNAVSTHPNLNGEPEIEQKAIFVNTDTDIGESYKLTLAARYTEQLQDYYSCSYEDEQSSGVGLNVFFTALTALQAGQLALNNPAELLERILDGSLPFDTPPRGEGNCYVTDGKGQTNPYEETLDENNTSWRAALTHYSENDNTYYASVSRGYKAGGFPVLNASSTKQYVPATQEELTSYEIGSKLSFFEGKLQLDLAAFHYQYKDKQLLTRISDPVFGPLPLLKNAPESEINGFEFDLKTSPITGLTLVAVGSYVDSEVKEFESTDFNGQDRDFAGQPFNFSPKYQGTLLADYVIQFGSDFDVGATIDISYSSETNGTLEEDPRYAMDEWTVYGARIYLSNVVDNWEVSLWGRNLTNELVNTGAFNLGDTVVRFTGMPRTYGVNFGIKF